MLRVFKVFVNFRLSEEVSRRSRRQIWSVIIFFAYFMTLASIIGIQMFGAKNHYCVKNSVDFNNVVKNVTYNDVPLPEARCSLTSEKGYYCPSGFSCKEVKLDGFMGARRYFDHFGYSLLTVYVSATQEGWVLVMYQMMNVRSKLLVAIYFVLLIFFLALLVKNVFIAVVSETFADLRSHYTMSRRQTRRRRYTGLSSLVIKDHGAGWHLVSVDHEASKGHAPFPIRRVIGSVYVQYFIWTCVFVDALIQAINKPWRRLAQFIFTLLFDIEVLLKIWCSGFRAYLNNSRMQCVEFVIAAGSTVLAIPVLLGFDEFAVFHVMRVIRLVGAIPGLQAFSLKIFGTGKKLGSIILLTFFFVMLLSAIGMQLFSTLKDEDDDSYIFGTYTQSLESMFQILTQEGWVEVMEKSMKSAEEVIPAILVACFLTLYHVFSSLIIMSVFVAVIVDNLELDEDVKIMKQHKMDEDSSVTHEKLPLRIRIYERFKEDPRLVRMSRLKFASEFPTPKIRESFMRRFVNTETLTDLPLDLSSDGDDGSATQRIPGRRAALHDLPVQLLNSSISEASRSTKIFRKQSTVSALINDSNHRRTLAQLSPTDITQGKNTGFRSASRRFRTGGRTGRGAVTEADVKRAIVMASQGNKKLHSQLSQEEGTQRDWDIQSLREKREQAQSRRRFQEETLRENHPFFDQPLFALPRDSWFRGFLQSIVHARYTIPPGYRDRATRNRLVSMETIQKTLASQTYLEWAMVFITLASCLSMMKETLEFGTFQNDWTSFFEHFFVVAMSIELGIRILADGLLFTPNAIIQNIGGVLDMFIYFNGLVYICWQPKEVRAGSGAQILMILRCLRPLRIITLMPKMKKVIMELCGGYKEILKVSALQLILMFSFAIYGVQVFSNKLKRCNDVTITDEKNCTGYFMRSLSAPRELGDLSGEIPSMLVPRVWKNPRNFNFDDVFNAFLALVEVLSLEGWLEVRDVIRDQPDVSHVAVFVHIYVLFGSMIGLTLFVGVVVTNFNEHKGIALLTVDQRRWQDLKKRLKLAQPLHLPPRPDEPGIQKKLYDVMQSVFYRRIVAVIVLLECLTLAVAQWTTADKHVRNGVTTLAAACTLFFLIDAILKIIAYTFEGYWRSMRNRFDMLLTTLGIIWIILNFSLKDTDMYQGCLIFGVVIIVFRFLTLSGKHNTLKMLMLTVVMSLVKSFFTIAVLVVLMMCYSLAGVILFGSVKYGEAINHNANFETSFEAMILLFRIITGEDWNKVMHDCMIDVPYCTPADDTSWRTDCGNEAAAIVFFISFYVLVTFILLNVFVAVIIENFSLFYASDEDSYLSNTDLRDFQMAWNLVDKGRRGIMSVPQARLFLRVYIFFKQNNYLKGRLGVDDRSTSFRHMCCEIEKLRNGGDVSFHDVLGVIAYRTVDISHCLQINELLEREELEYTIDQEVAIQTIRDWFIKLRMKREREKQKKERSSPLASSNESLNNAGLGDESDREQREYHERDRLSSGEEEEREPEKIPAIRTLSSQSAGFLAPPSSPPRQRKFSGPDRFSSPRKTSSVSFPTEVVEPPPPPILRQRQRSIPIEQKENTEVSDWWTVQLKDDFPFPTS